MDGDRQIRLHEPDEFDALFRIHRDHHEGQLLGRDRGSAEMDEHEVDRLVPLIPFGDLFQIVDQQRVARLVDAVAAFKVRLLGLR